MYGSVGAAGVCECVSVCAHARACEPANEAPQYSGEAAAKGPFS